MKPNLVSAFFVGWLVYVVGTTVHAMDGMFPFFGAIVVGPFVTGVVIGIGLLVRRWLKPRLDRASCSQVRLLCCAATGLGALTLMFASQFDFLSDKERVLVDDYINVIRLDVAAVSFALLVWGVLFFPVKTAPAAKEAHLQSQ